MTYRGYSVLALLSIALLVLALGQSIAGLVLENWWLMGDAGVMALCGLALAQLSVLDG